MKTLKYLILFFQAFLFSNISFAEYYKLYEPKIIEGEKALEFNNALSSDKNPDLNGYLNQILGFENGVTDFWKYELSVEIERDAGPAQRSKITNWKFENIFTPYRPGELWADLGFYLEVEKAAHENIFNIETKFLFQKEFASTIIFLVNAGVGHQVGPEAEKGLNAVYSLRLKDRINKYFEPGIEYYASLGRVDAKIEGNQKTGQIGPVVQGKIGKFLYDGGLLLGVNDSSFERIYKLNFEYEF